MEGWYNSRTDDTPFISYGCILICCVIFIVEQILGMGGVLNSLAVYSAAVLNGQLWRLVSAAFVHLSWSHILMNMYAFSILGTKLEQELGHRKFGVLLFASIIAGNCAVCVLAPRSIAAGMSTGLYGLMMYDIVHLAMQYGLDDVLHDSGIRYTILVNLIMNFMPGISWQGHLGGTLAGIAFAMTDRKHE